MCSVFRYKLEKFTFTSLESDNILLRSLCLNLSITSAFNLLKTYVSNIKTEKTKVDEIHHEIFTKFKTHEITYCFSQDESMHAILSINAYSKRRGITHKELIKVVDSLRNYFGRFLIVEDK